MITTIPDRERDLQAQVDALKEELASVEASNRIRGDELARLRAVEPFGWFYDITNGDQKQGPIWQGGEDRKITEIVAEDIGAKVFPLYRAAPPAQPAHPDEFACPLCFDDPANIKPAEPVQRLSDERAAFEAWHNEYRTQELVRRDDTYYNTHVRCRWEGWQARAIESALQPGWRPEWPAFVEYWTHESHLQTFADRERFRAAAKAMLEAAPKATK